MKAVNESGTIDDLVANLKRKGGKGFAYLTIKSGRPKWVCPCESE